MNANYFDVLIFFFNSNYVGGYFLGKDMRYLIAYILLLLSIFLVMKNKFFKSTNSTDTKNNDLMVYISMFILLLFTAVYPVWLTRLILERRLLAQELATHLPLVNFITYFLYALLALIVLFIVKNMDIKKRIIRESNYDELGKRVSFFLLTFFTISYIVWQLNFSQPRYIIPLEILSPLIIVVLLTYIVRDVTLRHWYILILFVMIAVTVLVPTHSRISWGDPFFRVKVPKVEQLDESIIVMAGKDALAYLIPFFPSGARFVRIESYFRFANPGIETRFQKEIKELIKNHRGPFYLLSRGKYILEHERVVEAYNLSVYRDESYAIISEHETDDLRLWKVQKIN